MKNKVIIFNKWFLSNIKNIEFEKMTIGGRFDRSLDRS